MTGAPNMELATLRESQDRALHREGIPMVVGLVDERVGARGRPDPDESGRQLALRMESYRAELGPEPTGHGHGILDERPDRGSLRGLQPGPAGVSALTFSAHCDLVAGGRFVRLVNYHNTPAFDPARPAPRAVFVLRILRLRRARPSSTGTS